jgi:RNA polymerase sigma-70 factor (ECF subfamily)
MIDGALLARRVREGGTDASDEVFRVYHRRIYRYVCRMVGNPEDASDMVQESFLKAYRALLRGEEPTNLSAWLYRIASNTCMDMLRRRRLIRWQPLDDLLSTLHIAGGPDPEQEMLRSEACAGIERVLAQLPSRYRLYLILRECQGFSYKEIAAITGDSVGMVKTTLYRARERACKIARKLSAAESPGRTRSSET